MRMLEDAKSIQAIMEHTSLRFKNQDWSTKNYYIIYLWGNGISPFDELDLRGH